MSREKILLFGDSLLAPTGFSTDLGGIAWSLADKYDVYALGLQTYQDHKVELNIHNEKRNVTQLANNPRGNDKWDFGKRSLPKILDELEPDLLFTVNDIQMVQHIPDIMCKSSINLQVMDLPSKQFLSEEALKMQLLGQLQKFKEKYPRSTKFLMYAPQDGDPPMPQWGNIYKMADQVVAMSYYGKEIFKTFFGMEVPKVWHGVDTDIFKLGGKPKELESKFIIGNLNRNQPRKQPVRTMAAFARFARDKPDVLLHMQMDWNDEFGWPIGYFSDIYGIGNKMLQPARVGIPAQEVAKIYGMWDLNLNCTGGEGFGLCISEGMSCGIPNIGCDYTTTKELTIDGQPSPRGSLVKIKDMHWQKLDVAAVRRSLVDIEDLANVMNKYYYNRDLVKEHGKNAREWTEKNLAWKVIQKQWKEVVEKVLAGEAIDHVENI